MAAVDKGEQVRRGKGDGLQSIIVVKGPPLAPQHQHHHRYRRIRRKRERGKMQEKESKTAAKLEYISVHTQSAAVKWVSECLKCGDTLSKKGAESQRSAGCRVGRINLQFNRWNWTAALRYCQILSYQQPVFELNVPVKCSALGECVRVPL